MVFGVSLILTMVLSGYFIKFSGDVENGLEDLHAYEETIAVELGTFKDVELVLLNDAWEIKWLDEVLTHTVARYIQSGGQEYWDVRYQQHALLMDEAFNSSQVVATASDYAILENVAEAQAKLSGYDNQIRALVLEASSSKDRYYREDKYEEAISILYGDYQVQKAIYSGGMKEFFEQQQDRLDTSITDKIEQATIGMAKAEALIEQANTGRRTALGLIAGIIVVNLALGYKFSNSITSRIKSLKEISDKLSIGEIDGLSVDVSGDDEIGELGEAMKGVVAAMETMITDLEHETEYDMHPGLDAVNKVEVR
jgi:methyl-accepting chemotaxis protein